MDDKKYYSDLPKATDGEKTSTDTAAQLASVSAVKNLERKQMLQDAENIIEPNKPLESASLDKTHFIPAAKETPKTDKLTKSVKYAVGAAVGFIIFIIILVLMMVFSNNSVVKFTGTVKSQNGSAVEGASVMVDQQTVKTNNEGQFSIDVKGGTYTIKITAMGYKDLSQQVALTQDYLSSNNQRIFVLEALGHGTFTGKLVAKDNAAYKFDGDKILFNDQEYEVNNDGTFNLPESDTGKYTIEFRSPNYVDFKLTDVELKPGVTNLDVIELEPAGDIIGELKTFLTDEVNLEGTLVIEGVPTENLKVEEDGEFTFKDLKPGTTYKLRASAEGFNTRDYEIKVVQGENKLLTFRFIETGKVAYISDRDRDAHIYIADYDGKNEQKVTQRRYNPFGIDLVDGHQFVLFASGQGTINFYSAKVVGGGEPQKLTEGVLTDKLKNVYPNYTAEKFITVYKDRTTSKNILEVLTITGQGSVKIEEVAVGDYIDPRISDNGSFLAYILNDDKGSFLYRANANTAEKQKVNNDNVVAIYDISASGNRVLYGEFDKAQNVTKLKYADLTRGETVTLANATRGIMYQFAAGSESDILYIESRDAKSNIYKLNIDTKVELKLTTRGGVESILQQSGLILYYSDLGLFVMDPTKPVEGKFVTDKVVRYTGYEF